MIAATRWVKSLPSSLALKILFIFFAAIVAVIGGGQLLTPQPKTPSPTPRVAFKRQVELLFATQLAEATSDADRAQLCLNMHVSAVISSTTYTNVSPFKCGPYADRLVTADNVANNDTWGFEPTSKPVPEPLLIGEHTVVISPNFEFERKEFRQYSFVFLVLSIVTLLFVYLAIKHQIDPLNELALAIRGFGDGHAFTPPAINRRDEIGQISKSLHRMSQQIKNLIDTKEQLLLDISHELRSPLTRLRMAIELQNSNEMDKAPILKEAKEIDRLVSLLLDGAKIKNSIEHFQFQEVRLAGFLQDVCADLEQIDNTQKIKTNFSDQVKGLCVKIDERYFRMALRNLIENSKKYTSNRTTPIEVTLTMKNSHWAQISVRDYGRGIPADAQEKIFEPFFRLDKARTPGTSGLGLGLNFVRRIVDAHVGKVFVDSQVTRGTSIVIELPIV